MYYEGVGRFLPRAAARLLAVAFLTALGFADIGPTPGGFALPSLFRDSDVVCFGRAEHATEAVTGIEGSVEVVSRSFGLLARRCYKGEFAAGDTVHYTSHNPGIHTTDVYVRQGEDVLVFLKQTGSREFTFAFPYYGRLIDASLDVLAPGPGTGLEQLQRDVVASTTGVANPRILQGNFRVLHGFPNLSNEALALLRSYIRSSDPDIAMGAFAALTTVGDPADLAALCEFLNQPGGPAISAGSYYNFGALLQIRQPEARSALECLARSPVDHHGLRMAAMEAIRGIASPASVPELIRRLDDADPTIQLLAVASLAEIVRRPDEESPSVPAFEANRAKYIQSWKRWWEEAGRNLYAPVRK